MTNRNNKPEDNQFDIEATKQHIMTAGFELLAAAHGALAFCREYVERELPKGAKSGLLGLFQKAISVADDLGQGMPGVEGIARAAEGLAKPFFDSVSKEMSAQDAAARTSVDKAASKKTSTSRRIVKKASPAKADKVRRTKKSASRKKK